MKVTQLLFIGLAFLCLNISPLHAQQRSGSLKGTIQNEKAEPLPFANIVIKDTTGVIVTGGTSDIDGKYIINPVSPGTYKAQVLSIGYTTITVVDIHIYPNIPTIHDFQMQPSSASLEEVTVISRRPIAEKSVATSKKISSEQITNLAVRSVSSTSKRSSRIANRNRKPKGARSEGTEYFVNGITRRGNGDVSAFEDQRGENESYDLNGELPFKGVNSFPLSTFSSDVDAASYANVRRFITEGYLPPSDAVRIEEMVNYFSYNYPDPAQGEVFSMNTELGPCPWKEEHQLLRIGIKTKDIDKEYLPDNNLVFLIDVSGSMGSADKLPLLKKSLRLLVSNLNESDRVAIVVYASATGLVLESTKGTNKKKILQAIGHLESGGSTAGGAGLELAYKVAIENFKKGENNRVILATDGDFNVGLSSDQAMVKLIEKKRESGVFLTVLGFGTGNLQDSKMEKIADHGNGNYAYIDNLMEAQKVLVNEMGATLNAVAKDTKFQIEFNPQQVSAYRLIGYENRVLQDEDFNDDTKDAGDVGSGHHVTAIYEIIPAGTDEKLETPPIDPLKYQQKTGLEDEALSAEFATVKIRYKAPDSETSVLQTHIVELKDSDDDLSEDFHFICGVLEAGMLLRNSEFAGDSSFKEAKKLAIAGKGEDIHGYRGEFIRLISLADKLSKQNHVGSR